MLFLHNIPEECRERLTERVEMFSSAKLKYAAISCVVPCCPALLCCDWLVASTRPCDWKLSWVESMSTSQSEHCRTQ